MADFLKTGVQWLAGQIKDHASQPVTYRRGASENSNILATLGESEFPRESREGLTTEERTQDFLISVADLTLGSTQVTPEPGDQVVVSGLGTFEVTSPGGSEPAWRYSDSFHTILRIHTREISS